MRPHILVVEDEKHLGVGIKYNLEAENYRVTLVEDGPTALRLLESGGESIDLMVLDLMLPGMSGYSVCETVRESGRQLRPQWGIGRVRDLRQHTIDERDRYCGIHRSGCDEIAD